MGQPNLELLHKTILDEIPYAMCAFQGKVLIGVGKLLRLYDLGKKKMLRKCENKHIPHIVVGIQTIGDRILVSDVQESVHFVKYRRGENQLVMIYFLPDFCTKKNHELISRNLQKINYLFNFLRLSLLMTHLQDG